MWGCMSFAQGKSNTAPKTDWGFLLNLLKGGTILPRITMNCAARRKLAGAKPGRPYPAEGGGLE